MFSFRACFWNKDVYINEKNKYAVNELLTAYLNHGVSEEAKDFVYELKSLKRKLWLDPDMDYENYMDYDLLVHRALDIFSEINGWIGSLPPYDQLFQHHIPGFDDLLSGTPFFDVGVDPDEYDELDWDTVSTHGYVDQWGNGNLYIHLTKFEPEDPDSMKLDYNPEAQRDLERFNARVDRFFSRYIILLQSLISVEEIFAPFITEWLHRGNGFPGTNEIARYYEQFNGVGRTFEGITCRMQSFGYKVLRDEQNQPILCEEIQFEDLQSFLFYDFFYGLRQNYLSSRCKHCGKFFLIRAGKYTAYCDRPLPDEPDKTCRDIGSRRRYDEKCKTDPVWQTYNRAYKAHYARYMKKKMTVSEFEEWSRFASELRDKAAADEMTFEEYEGEIKK